MTRTTPTPSFSFLPCWHEDAASMTTRLSVSGLCKTFTLHTQGGTRIPVFAGLNLSVRAGECVCLHGASGSGKSTLLRSLYATYKPQAGAVRVEHDGEIIDLVTADPWQITAVRSEERRVGKECRSRQELYVEKYK